jgi:membrane-bound lytic murein transglycosylase B
MLAALHSTARSLALFSHRLVLTIGLISLTLACSGDSDSPASPVSAPAIELATPTAEPEPAPQATVSPWAGTPVLADGTAGIAEQLTTAERALRDGRTTGLELAWMAHLQQLVYRRLVEESSLRATMLAALPDDVRPVAVANIEAGVSLRALVTPARALPAWRIVEPAPLDELLAYYREAETDFGVPWQYLAAVHLVETFMGRIRGTSSAGAQGPMQFIPSTWAAFGEGDINNTRDAVRAAARYLRASGAPRNLSGALYAYNPSQHYVRAVTGYAEAMRTWPEAFRGYYHWQVYYLTAAGDTLLPMGYVRE